MTPEIQRLLDKWREAAAWELTDGNPEFGKGLDQAADELEAALLALPADLPPPEARLKKVDDDDQARVDQSALSGPTGSTAREQPDSVRRLLDSATMRNARKLLAHLGRFRNQEHYDVLARLLDDIEQLSLSRIAGADHTYDCGCYWFCGNIVACRKHSPHPQGLGATTDANAVDPPAEGRERGLRATKESDPPPEITPPAPQDERGRWYPIETAPKDGTWMVLTSAKMFPVIGKWSEVIDGWVAHSMPQFPTHWMPLPDPPAAFRLPPEGE